MPTTNTLLVNYRANREVEKWIATLLISYLKLNTATRAQPGIHLQGRWIEMKT